MQAKMSVAEGCILASLCSKADGLPRTAGHNDHDMYTGSNMLIATFAV